MSKSQKPKPRVRKPPPRKPIGRPDKSFGTNAAQGENHVNIGPDMEVPSYLNGLDSGTMYA